MNNDKELHTYYSLSECLDMDKVIKKLDSLRNDGKIVYQIQASNDSLKLEDIELNEKEVVNLIDFLDKNDIMPDIDKEESMGDLDDDLDGGLDDWDENY